MPVIPPVIDEHRQHHTIRLWVVRSGACFRMQGTQRFHESILEFSALVAVYDEGHSKSQYDVVDQQISYSISTLILHRESLRPLTEVIGNHQNLPESLRCRVTDVQDVHGDTVPAMTGADIA